MVFNAGMRPLDCYLEVSRLQHDNLTAWGRPTGPSRTTTGPSKLVLSA
jgi:hypothetical protein